jgi:hypothetical protein
MRTIAILNASWSKYRIYTPGREGSLRRNQQKAEEDGKRASHGSNLINLGSQSILCFPVYP